MYCTSCRQQTRERVFCSFAVLVKPPSEVHLARLVNRETNVVPIGYTAILPELSCDACGRPGRLENFHADKMFKCLAMSVSKQGQLRNYAANSQQTRHCEDT